MNLIIESLIIPIKIIQLMKAQSEAGLPEEVCGLLSGTGKAVQRQFSITNTLHSSSKFNMDGNEMLSSFNWMEEHSQDLMAIYHSHPSGPITPSETDLAEDFYPGVIKIIVSKVICDWQIKGFIIKDAVYREFPLIISYEKLA